MGNRTRTLRGSIDSLDGFIKEKLIISDGRLNHGLKVLSFTMFADNLNPVAGGSFTLALGVLPTGAMFDASDNRQIAWTAGGYNENTPLNAEWRMVIDPDHVINRDLYLVGFSSINRWNYLIECEEQHLSDDQAIISIIKETSQSSRHSL